MKKLFFVVCLILAFSVDGFTANRKKKKKSKVSAATQQVQKDQATANAAQPAPPPVQEQQPIVVNQVVTQTAPPASSAESKHSGSKEKSSDRKFSRNYTLGMLGGFFADVKSSTSGSNSTEAILNARFGWNIKILEYGGVFSIEHQSVTSTTTTSGGGFIDYNFNENKDGVNLVTSIMGEYVYHHRESTATADCLIGLAIKYFPFSMPVAIRTDVSYKMTFVDEKDASNFIYLRSGLQVYF